MCLPQGALACPSCFICSHSPGRWKFLLLISQIKTYLLVRWETSQRSWNLGQGQAWSRTRPLATVKACPVLPRESACLVSKPRSAKACHDPAWSPAQHASPPPLPSLHSFYFHWPQGSEQDPLCNLHALFLRSQNYSSSLLIPKSINSGN